MNVEIDRQYRQLPHNIPVEQALLGAILINNQALHRVALFLDADHFFEPAHGRIYHACRMLIERGRLASPVTLVSLFENDEGLEDVGGSQYLARLAASVVSVLDVEDYGRTVYDLALRRQLISVGQEMVDRAYKPDVETSATDQAQDATIKLDSISYGVNTDQGTNLYLAVQDAAQASLDLANGIGEPPLSTGFADLDDILSGGLWRSQYLLLAGRPSMGKSALALAIMLRIAEAGERVAFFSLEMSAAQNAQRAIGAIGNVPYVDIIRGERASIERAGPLAGRQRYLENVWINETGQQTIEQVRAKLLMQHRRKPFRLVVIDSLELIEPSRHTLAAPRVYQLKHSSNTIMALCKLMDVPFLVLHQLNRDVERTDDRRPQLHHLRDSGSLEQDAHTCMFIYREHFYAMKDGPNAGEDNDTFVSRLVDCEKEADVFVRKNRMGRTGEAKLYADMPRNRFGNLAFKGGYGSATD